MTTSKMSVNVIKWVKLSKYSVMKGLTKKNGSS